MEDSAQLLDLAGKTALVMGASHGLGATFAQALTGAGAQLVLPARSADTHQAVSQGILETGGMALAIPCDVSDPGQVEAMVARAVERLGRVNILVNNAGVAPDGGTIPERMSPDVFEQIVRINLLGTWYGCHAVYTRMLRDGQGGSITNIAFDRGLERLDRFSGGLPGHQSSRD